MNKIEFFEEYVKHKEPNITQDAICTYEDTNISICAGCGVYDICETNFGQSRVKYSQEEFEEIQEKFPEYFI